MAETVHIMGKTEEAFRLIVLRWQNRQKDFWQKDLFSPNEHRYHVIAINLECSAEKVVWEYHDREQMENIIKELKAWVGMESLPAVILVQTVSGFRSAFWHITHSFNSLCSCLCWARW